MPLVLECNLSGSACMTKLMLIKVDFLFSPNCLGEWRVAAWKREGSRVTDGRNWEGGIERERWEGEKQTIFQGQSWNKKGTGEGWENRMKKVRGGGGSNPLSSFPHLSKYNGIMTVYDHCSIFLKTLVFIYYVVDVSSPQLQPIIKAAELAKHGDK